MPPNQERQAGISIVRNGIDFITPNAHPAFLYETHCFRVIAAKFAPDFVVGPHLVDHILGRDRTFSQMTKPDAFIFNRTNSCLTLKALAEFKSGVRLRSERKLTGFTHLLRKIRSTPGFLPYTLNRAIGELIDIPKHIYIPDDQQISVVFVGRHPCGTLYQNGSKFSVSYLLIE